MGLAPHGILAKLWGWESADPGHCRELMSQSENVLLIPGGFEGSTLCAYDEYRLILKERKGFIKYALRYGYKVYPVFVFKENKFFKTINRWEKFRLLVNKLKLPSCLFYSKYFPLPLPDRNLDIRIVMGSPLILPQIQNPTSEELGRYHGMYMDHLQKLFDKYQPLYDPGAQMSFVM